MYVAFTDFRKAFDTICRTKLWTLLHRNVLRGKIAIALQSMYAIVMARVRVGGGWGVGVNRCIFMSSWFETG